MGSPNMTKEAIVKAPSGRVRRTPVGTRNKLTVYGKEPGYHYRIVNDVDDGARIQEFLEAGYEFVPAKDVKVGDKRIEATSSEGTNAQVHVGGGQKAFVMRIKQEWYDEDQAAKQRQLDELESTTREKALDGTYGKFDIKRD